MTASSLPNTHASRQERRKCNFYSLFASKHNLSFLDVPIHLISLELKEVVEIV